MTTTRRTALITGAGRGIGKGCAVELARSGLDVVVNDRPGSPDLAATVAVIEELGVRCLAVAGDAFSRAGCEAILQQALAAVGHIDVLVSNPARSIRREFLDYDPVDFEQVIQGTLVGGFHMGQLVARHMAERGVGGKILFISSVQAEMPFARCVAYGAAKAGLNHVMQTMAVELAAHRINVNAIEPGWIDTPGEHEAFAADVIEREGAKLPFGRLGTPTDIGRAAAFLSSDAADYISGAILPVDGVFRFKDCRAADVIPPRAKE